MSQTPEQAPGQSMEQILGDPVALLTFLIVFYGGVVVASFFYGFRDALIARLWTWAVLTPLSFVVNARKYGIGFLIHAFIVFRKPLLWQFGRSVLRLLARDGSDDDHLVQISTNGLMTLGYCSVFLTLANISTIFALIRTWWPWTSFAAGMVIAIWATSVYCFGMPILSPVWGFCGLLVSLNHLYFHLLTVIRRATVVLYTRMEAWHRAYSSYKIKLLGDRRPSHWGQPYVYSPLTGSRGIRLLRISRKSPFGEYSCAMVHTTLDLAPAFEAISYHWGEPVLDRKLIIDGRALEVTSRVVEIIQSRASCLDEKMLWIDAACINQKDLAEKGQQILLIRDIYQKAHTVLVWLGTPFDAHDATGYMMEVTSSTLWSNDHNVLRNIMSSFSNDRRGPALFSLLNHPWWSRAWAVQEIAVAKKVVFCHGNSYRNWESFQIFLRGIEKLTSVSEGSLASLFPKESNRAPAFFTQMPFLTDLRTKCQATDASLDFGEILHETQRRRASDPRDHVYAFLGLTTKSHDPLLAPDYAKPVAEVFTNTARYLCHHDMFKTITHSGIGHDSQVQSLPSWVPDFSSSKRNNTMHLAESSPELKAVCYRASGDIQSSYELHPSLPILRTSCLLFDSIAGLGPDCNPDNGVNSSQEDLKWLMANFSSMVDFILEIAGTGDYRYTGQPWNETMWRFMIGDRSTSSAHTKRPAPPVFGKYFLTVQGAMGENRDRLEKLEASHESSQALRAFPDTEDPIQQQTRFAEAAATADRGCRMAVTQGGALCLVPRGTHVGDVVGVMGGAQACSLFRTQAFPGIVDEAVEKTWTRPNWRLVGQAYVHGFMDGEALFSGRQWEDICIW